ncbi:MAG: chloramphenicol resistance protein, partial [Anaerolineaceae bacterium]
EEFADWLESQTAAGVLPTPGTKKTAESIEATGWGYLFEQGDSDTGIYQIQCKLVYRQQP